MLHSITNIHYFKQTSIRLYLSLLLFGVCAGYLVLKFNIYTFILYAGIIFVIIAARNPAFALVVSLFLGQILSTYSFSLGGSLPAITFDRAAIIVIVAGYLFHGRIHRSSHIDTLLLEKCMIIFCAIVLITTFLRFDLYKFIKSYLSFADSIIIPFIYFYLAKNLLYSEKNFGLVCWFALLLAIIISVCGTYEFLASTDLFPAAVPEGMSPDFQGLWDVSLMRSNGPYVMTATYGTVLGMLFFTVLYLFLVRLNQRLSLRFGTFLVLGGLASTFVGIFCSLLRMTLLALFIGLAFRVFLFKKALSKFLIAGLLFLFAITASWTWLSSTDNVLKNRFIDSETGYARLASWKIGLEIIPPNLILGAGFLGYKQAQQIYSSEHEVEVKGQSPTANPHNSFLLLAVETGIAGLLSFCAILFLIARYILIYLRKCQSAKHREFVALMIGIFCVYLIPSITVDTFLIPEINNLFFAFTGILIGRVHHLTFQSNYQRVTGQY